jgi:tRNA(Leu) C34 or U34 (ribose-2'-O)-methylase TrmL
MGFANQHQGFLYIAGEIVKDYENNIKLHFVHHLATFINVLYRKKERLAALNKESRAKLFAELKTAKDYLLFQPEAAVAPKKPRTAVSKGPPEPPAELVHEVTLAWGDYSAR